MRLDKFWSYRSGTGPHCQPAAVGSAAKASGFHTSCSPGAWSVLAAALGTGGAEGKAAPVQQREQPGPPAGPVGRVASGLA